MMALPIWIAPESIDTCCGRDMGIPISSAEDDAGFATLHGAAQEEDAA